MNFLFNKNIFTFIIYFFLFSFSFCISFNKDYPEKKSFLIEVSPSQESNKPRSLPSERVIKLRKVNVSNKFSDKSFVYRRSETKYESDFYNEFLISPQQNIAEEFIRYLDRSNVFQSATDMSSRIEASHFIEIDVIQLYGDFRDSSKPKSLIELQIRVFDDREADYKPVWRKNYQRAIAMKNETPEALVIGWDSALSEITKEFISDANNWK
ncbi:MAG: hypothetical protein O9346_03940 [Leptospiraceae bacterium]|jgi:cholesterol transport system auxiliary component|nr:hypothetical protein [Leptospiraceae bacterium]MCZ8345547.1 hypothetical protein [Leptospiraceae bacterium]